MSEKQDLSSKALYHSDEKLKDLKFDKYSHPASNEAIEATKKALEGKTHKVTVVDTKEEALKTLVSLIPEGASIYNAGSTTLGEIGFIEFAKKETKWNNVHAKLLSEQDPAKKATLQSQSYNVDYFLSSVSALAQTGEFVAADLTGTRVGGFLPSKNLLLVVGSNKIVATKDDAIRRLEEYVLPLESARVRVVYKLPASAANNVLVINSANPWGAPGRVHVILVKEALGF